MPVPGTLPAQGAGQLDDDVDEVDDVGGDFEAVDGEDFDPSEPDPFDPDGSLLDDELEPSPLLDEPSPPLLDDAAVRDDDPRLSVL